MLSQVFYLVRSKQDGQYLVARPRSRSEESTPNAGFLLMFKEHYDALSYLNAHGRDLADQFSIETLPGTHLKGLLQRWGFLGVGVVQDPLVPQIEFMLNE